MKGFVKIFNIREEESKPVFYLMIFSFFVGLSMTFYFAASNAIFLKHFASRMISVSYMASGVIVWAAWLLLSRLDRRLTNPQQLILKFLFVFITVLAISIGVWRYDEPWLVFIMFTWVRILVYITVVTFWGLAGKLFNIRQGKRIFALLGIGEVISIIIGYFSVPVLLKFMKAPDLLFLSSGALLACLIIVSLIVKVFRRELSGSEQGAQKLQAKNELNYRKLVRRPYFMLISLMALLPIFGYLFVDFLFLAQTKTEFANDTEAIAGFFGIFLGFVAVIELLFKLISGRFLSKYGLKPSLLSLPVVLFGGMLMAAVTASLYGTTGLFFAFIAMVRLFERSVRSAVYEPAFQLLYQPVPAAQRLVFQNQIEGIPKASGTVITGAVILLFSAIHAFNLVHYSWFFILVLALWIRISYRMYSRYRKMLRSKLAELGKGEKNHSDPAGELVKSCLRQSGTGFDQAYRIMNTVYPFVTEEVIPELFEKSSDPIRISLLQKIRENQLVSILPFLRSFGETCPEGRLKSELEQTLSSLSGEDRSPNLSTLVHSPLPEDRRYAACRMASSGKYSTSRLLIGLMHDEDLQVRKAALRSAGKARRTEYWPEMIQNLTDSRFAAIARTGLQQIGEPVLTELARFFDKAGGDLVSRQQMIMIFETAGGPKAIRFLRSNMMHPDRDVRMLVLMALSRMGYRASVNESLGIKGQIEELVENILWTQACLLDIGKAENAGPVQMALLDLMEENKQTIFMLLALLYDSRTMKHVMEHIESKDVNAKVYAMEIGDMLIGEELKQIIFPLFEDITMQERLQRTEHRFLQEKMEPVERMPDILNREMKKTGVWVKARAIEWIGATQTEATEEIRTALLACLSHPHRLIVEVAAQAIIRLDEKAFGAFLCRFKQEDQPLLFSLADQLKKAEEQAEPLLSEKIRLIRNQELFLDIPENVLVELLVRYRDGWIKRATPGKNPETGCLPAGDDWFFLPGEEFICELADFSPAFIKRYFTLNNIHHQNEGS